jgi:ribonuclease BN (tRNA processing enzyme)
VLVRDCQYTDEEHPRHLGWGHSRLTDTLALAQRAAARRLPLSHHDPLHDDATLDAFATQAAAAWEQRGGRAEALALAHEGQQVDVGAVVATAVY